LKAEDSGYLGCVLSAEGEDRYLKHVFERGGIVLVKVSIRKNAD